MNSILPTQATFANYFKLTIDLDEILAYFGFSSTIITPLFLPLNHTISFSSLTLPEIWIIYHVRTNSIF
jgi:hypothetical protein